MDELIEKIVKKTSSKLSTKAKVNSEKACEVLNEELKTALSEAVSNDDKQAITELTKFKKDIEERGVMAENYFITVMKAATSKRNTKIPFTIPVPWSSYETFVNISKH